MAGSVIKRLGYHIDDAGLIHYQEQPATWGDADALARRRVDRRLCYAIFPGDEDGGLKELARWTQRCSGCSGDDPYEDRGSGCPECGYHGVVRSGAWVPYLSPERRREAAS